MRSEGYTYSVLINQKVSLSQFQQIEAWLNENCDRNGWLWNVSGALYVSFVKQSDAVLFQLSWG
jgi:hypothetical protein